MNLSELMPNQDDQLRFLQQLKKHETEGLTPAQIRTAFIDTEGYLTIGIGHNCIAHPINGVEKVGDKISQELVDDLFYVDVNSHVDQFSRRCPWVSQLNSSRQAVLFNMAFNMGIPKLMKFSPTFDVIQAGDYKNAAWRLLNTNKWAKQVGDYAPDSPRGKKNGRPGRAWELAKQMETGEWQ